MSLWSTQESTQTMDNTSNRSSDEYIDDALITDSVKKLLSGDHSDGHHFDLTADLLTNASNASNTGVNCGQMPGHSGATVQEGMDLVDALDTLVQHLSRESNNAVKPVSDIPENDSYSPTEITPIDVIVMDHNYCQTYNYYQRPNVDTCADTAVQSTAATTSPQKAVVESSQSPQKVQLNTTSSSSFTTYNDNSYASSSTASATSPSPTRFPGSPTPPLVKSPPKTPTASRRSQRQIDRIEKTVLEKIKAENQEMLKREKETMESPNKLRPTVEPLDDIKDTDDSELVIDLDKKKDNKIQSNNNNNNNKKRMKRKSQTIEPTNKKSRMDGKQQIIAKNSSKPEIQSKHDSKPETSELDDVIAALSGVTDADDSSPASGRQQRTRRKPKRWDDDEVEVDFSGQLGILAEEQKQKLENDENRDQSIDNDIKEDLSSDKVIKNEEKVIQKTNESKHSSGGEDMDDEEEEGSDFMSEDDPDKLWCICRQPHDDRFMIGCDSCEEWFHGNCVNVTKQQGRIMEKAGQEWLCSVCTKGISEGIPREELKKAADQKRHKLEAEERVRAQTKRMAKEKFLKREKSRENVKQLNRERTESTSETKKPVQRQPSAEKQIPKASILSARKVSQMPPKKRELHLRLETEESEKLKKCIKSAKKDFNKKQELMNKKKSFKDRPQQKKGLELQPISKVVPIVRKPEVKKKHKDAIDPTVQDLFKAEPIKKTSSTTPSTPTTPGTPGGPPFSRKSSVDSRRQSISGPPERLCPSGCGKTVRNDTSIYCNNECIENYVNETLKQLKAVRRERYDSGVRIKDIDRRVILVDKVSGRLLSGKESIPEKDVMEYIKANQNYECFRPSLPKADKKKDDSSLKTILTPQKSPKKEERKSSVVRSNSRSGESESGDPIRANVRTTLKETLINRCKEANESLIDSKDIQRIALRIEEELFKAFNKDTSGKYRNKYRSLIFNLKDTKNQGLFRKVVNGKISPERLVQMSAEELASSELAKWREREKISMLEMIKRDAAEKVSQVIVKKTHKGEELIENNSVNESTNEHKLDDLKALNQTSAPLSDASTLLDDLMGTSTVDTTSQHKTHLFSNNCRICTNKQSSDDSKHENKRSSVPSASREEPSRPTPKRVRVDPDSANKILAEAAKLSTTLTKRTASADDEDSHEVPTSTVSLSSPEVPSSSSASRPVWKGNIFMQDVAKFAANAVKVSGTVGDFLSQDVSSQITVCGRIAPEQVLDYVKKLKYSSRTEIGLVKFVSPKDERIGYDAFFDYLDSRGRYGVVGSTGKWLKDFYILPLPKSRDVPEVLLPFDGPGLDKKSLRPNLLLGILIRSKRHVGPQTLQTSSTNTSQTKSKSISNSSESRSYTPPPKTPSNDSSPEDNKDLDDVSYTPPHMSSAAIKSKTSTKAIADEDEPYDPEEAELSNSLSSQSTQSIPELMEQIAKSSNPVEMTSSVLSAIASSSNVELQRRLLEQLTAKVDEQKKQLEEQKAEAEANASKNSSNSSSAPLIPGLDGQFASLKDITIPDNLQDILSTVKQKTQEIEQQQERLRAVAASGFKFVDPIVQNFGSKTIGSSESTEQLSEAEPMDLDDEVTTAKSTIIEVNTPVTANTTDTTAGAQQSATDPRLRSKKQTPLPSISQESGTSSQVAAMTADELMSKARQQMEALARMEANTGPNNPGLSTGNKNKNNNKIKIQWKKKK